MIHEDMKELTRIENLEQEYEKVRHKKKEDINDWQLDWRSKRKKFTKRTF
jgi:hypothetical protein